MSRKAREIAESAVDQAIFRQGLTKSYGAAGYREEMIQRALPDAEKTVRLGRELKDLKRRHDITAQALKQTETAIQAVEAIYARQSQPALPYFADYKPVVRPYVNGSKIPE